MRILHTVQLYEPRKGGSEEVVRQISEQLAARGHEVVVATGHDSRRDWESLNGVEVRQFEVEGNLTRGITGDVEGYQRFVMNAQVDVMMNYAAQIWSTDLCFDLLDRLDRPKVLVPCGYLLQAPEYADYFNDLPHHLLKYDALVYMSGSYQDYRFGEKVGVGDKAVIIPNGASREEFDGSSVSFRDEFGIKTPLMVLHVSNHFGLKGHKRIVSAFESLERDDVTLVMIGSPIGPPWADCYSWCKFKGVTNRRIKMLEVPRDLVVAAFKEADLFALASDVECAPLVIYESMASGTPFVSLDCGNVRDNQDYGLVVDTPEELGPAMQRLLNDSELRTELGELGLQAWRSRHTWDNIADQYERLYASLMQAR